MLDWLIIGGGVQGTHLSLHLTKLRGVPRDRLRVLDPFAEPLTLWSRFARNTGMRFLRSPVVHHIDIPAYALMHFSDTSEGRPHKRFTEPFDRPGTSLFDAHSRAVVRKNKLDELRVQGTAQALTAIDGGYRVETEHGCLESAKVLIAISAADMPLWPEWARSLKAQGAAIDHVFDAEFNRETVPQFESAVVIGGGITAAQTALALSRRAWGKVTLLTPHAPRVRWFDASPGWMGPLNIEGFRREPCIETRRAIIRKARYKGSMPPEVRGQLHQASLIGKLNVRVGCVVQGETANGLMRFTCDDGSTFTADRVVLATGFETKRPGGQWLDRAIADMNLPTAPCGYPKIDPNLMWRPGLYVTGALAELEVGPAARNIVGVRLVAEKLKA
ncbi:MAG: FAD-dependent oxidoreductase [Polyangiaceae bacterium]|nr:FAD-dependent oxidoreductase [Polyangiaceae bacterium]